MQVEEGVVTSGGALADIELALITILLIQEEERHAASVALLERISHQELRLADEFLLFRLLGVYLDDFKNKGFHGHWDARTSLTAHKLKAREVKALDRWIINRFLLVAEEWRNFAHNQFIDL